VGCALFELLALMESFLADCTYVMNKITGNESITKNQMGTPGASAVLSKISAHLT
jgi:hypothetical protein